MDSAYRLAILDTLDPEWESRTVDAVTFPAPPILAKSAIYAEDCWRSDVLERGESIFNDQGTCLGSAMTDRGPAFLLQYTLGDLFGRSERSDGIAVIPESIYCATISFASILESNGIIYATDAVIERVRSISASCHPGSHTSIPNSPWLTLLLELDRASDILHKKISPSFTFADHVDAHQYFPDIDFRRNEEVDQLFKYASLGPCMSTPGEVRIPPVLSDRLRSIIPILESNDRLSIGVPIEKYISLVNRRDEGASHE